jgi:3-isopropylmalate dehydrogenase
MANQRIAFIPGDGIGIEVTAEAIKVLETLIQTRKLPIEHVVFDWGAEKYLREGVSLPEGALDMLRREFHAIFIGALGDPRVPSN